MAYMQVSRDALFREGSLTDQNEFMALLMV